MSYAGNGSITRWLNAAITPWQVVASGDGSRLVGGAQIRASLEIDGIRPARVEGGDLVFTVSPAELVRALDDADYGAEIAKE